VFLKGVDKLITGNLSVEEENHMMKKKVITSIAADVIGIFADYSLLH
jgi:hypothetical protein